MRVVLEVDKCIGSGSCEMNAPEVFEVGEDGLAKLLNAAPGSEMEAECRMAEESCPTPVSYTHLTLPTNREV